MLPPRAVALGVPKRVPQLSPAPQVVSETPRNPQQLGLPKKPAARLGRARGAGGGLGPKPRGWGPLRGSREGLKAEPAGPPLRDRLPEGDFGQEEWVFGAAAPWIFHH